MWDAADVWSDALLGTDRERGTGDAPGSDASSQTNTVPSEAPGTSAWTWADAVSDMDAALGSGAGAVPQTRADQHFPMDQPCTTGQCCSKD